ncbi:hypothetical protein [Desulfamplus magnetovallimortis]|nr:hypothetical protein [Desulfamplus magnetovallimortis]
MIHEQIEKKSKELKQIECNEHKILDELDSIEFQLNRTNMKVSLLSRELDTLDSNIYSIETRQKKLNRKSNKMKYT